jgi:hypothetical protein
MGERNRPIRDLPKLITTVLYIETTKDKREINAYKKHYEEI